MEEMFLTRMLFKNRIYDLSYTNMLHIEGLITPTFFKLVIIYVSF